MSDDPIPPARVVRALAPIERPLPPLRLADKLETKQRGEFVALDRRGRVLGRRERVREAAWLLFIAAMCAYEIATTPIFGVAYSVIMGGLVGQGLRRRARYNRLIRLIDADRFDDAAQEISRLDERGGIYRAYASYGRLLLACRHGRLDEARAAAETCERQMGDRHETFYWAVRFIRASVLLELGGPDEAQAHRSFNDAMRAPDGDFYATMKRELECLRVFVNDRPDELGSDDELHDRARTALRYNHTGMTVGLLAWAYERRGDPAMCDHLVGEVAGRCLRGTELIERMHPRFWAWLGPKLKPIAAEGARP